MRKTALWPLQEAIFQRLNNDPAIIAAVTGGVFDSEVPEGQNTVGVDDDLIDVDGGFEVDDTRRTPYIVLGDDTVNDFSTKTFYGEELTHTLHIWSDYPGKKEVKQIMDLVMQSLTKSRLLYAGGFIFEDARMEMLEVFTDGDFKHGVMRFRFKIIQGE